MASWDNLLSINIRIIPKKAMMRKIIIYIEKF